MVFSPVVISIALAIACEGAKGGTREELLQLLTGAGDGVNKKKEHASSKGEEGQMEESSQTMIEYFSSLAKELKSPGRMGFIFRMANRLYLNPVGGTHFLPDYES